MSILRRRSTLPLPAPPLEGDDLLSEILLRLPPQPSSLPRASAVCKRWRSIASDPGFVHRFRRHHHRRNPPPLLGFFGQGVDDNVFEPTMVPPNRVPPSRFTMLPDARVRSRLLGCRHGLLLTFHQELKQVLVWDPVTGDQHSLPDPQGFNAKKTQAGAVLRPAGDAHHFQVVLAGADKQQQYTRAFACIYSSETGIWSDLVSTLLPSVDSTCSIPPMLFTSMPAVLAGDSLYWTLTRMRVILEFDLDKQSLAVIHLPVDKFPAYKHWDLTVMQAEGGGLGLLFMSDLTAQLWKKNNDCDGVASWVLGRTIELDKLLSLNPEQERQFLMIRGFAEFNNVVFLYTISSFSWFSLSRCSSRKFPNPTWRLGIIHLKVCMLQVPRTVFRLLRCRNGLFAEGPSVWIT